MTKSELREWMEYYHSQWIADHNRLVKLGIEHQHEPTKPVEAELQKR